MHISFTLVPYGSQHYHQAFLLRERILRAPQGTTFSSEEIEAEKTYIHVVGFFDDQICAAACLEVLSPFLKIRRVAVERAFQRSGIGSSLIVFCENYALKNSYKGIICNATQSAIPFYLKNDYLPDGDIQGEFPYQKMCKIF